MEETNVAYVDDEHVDNHDDDTTDYDHDKNNHIYGHNNDDLCIKWYEIILFYRYIYQVRIR